MNMISLTLFLQYLYQKFAVTFILSLIGAIIRETNTTADKRFNPKRVVISSIFVSILVCAIVDYIKMPFGIYALVCALCGMWGSALIVALLDANFMKTLLKNLLKTTKDPVAKAINETITESDKERKVEKKEEPPKVEEKPKPVEEKKEKKEEVIKEEFDPDPDGNGRLDKHFFDDNSKSLK